MHARSTQTILYRLRRFLQVGLSPDGRFRARVCAQGQYRASLGCTRCPRHVCTSPCCDIVQGGSWLVGSHVWAQIGRRVARGCSGRIGVRARMHFGCAWGDALFSVRARLNPAAQSSPAAGIRRAAGPPATRLAPPDKHPARRAVVWPAGGPAGHITFKHMADCHCGNFVTNQMASATSAECLTAQAQCWFGLATGPPGGAGRGLWGGWAAGGGAYTAHMEHT